MVERLGILDWMEERTRTLAFEYQKELERASHIMRVHRAAVGEQPEHLFHYTSGDAAGDPENGAVLGDGL